MPPPDPHAPAPEELPTRELVSALLEEAEELFRAELRLAVGELRQAAKRALGGAAVAAAGGAAGLVGLIVLTLDAVYLLAYVIPLWVSALVVGGAVATLGGLLAWGGLRQLVKALSTPRQVVEKVREDARWTRERIHEARSRTHASA